MAFVTREIESPDPVTRVAAADARARENLGDIGEKMVLNMGPSHPATHGVLRLALGLGGEVNTKRIPAAGFLPPRREKKTPNKHNKPIVPHPDPPPLFSPAPHK